MEQVPNGIGKELSIAPFTGAFASNLKSEQKRSLKKS